VDTEQRSGARTVEGAAGTTGRRIEELDALRGFALCGILVVNVYQQLVFERGGAPRVFPRPVELLFYERFLPLFAVLFGVGFGIFLQRAGARAAHPRLVLARRLAVLLVIGVVHFVFHRGEVLSSYALGGLVFLLPVSFLSGTAALAVAVVLLFVGPQIVVGYGMIPGLLVLGYALAALGVPAALPRRTGRLAVAGVVLTALALGWAALRLAGAEVPRVNVVGGLGGGTDLLPALAAIATSMAYACLFLLVLRTPVGPAVSALLAPMGRMALTNYLAATVLFLLLGPLLGIDSHADAPRIAVLTVGILLLQLVVSPLWLRSFRYGPVEWAWRCLTWWSPQPFRRVA
jgi:uncharacterized protein